MQEDQVFNDNEINLLSDFESAFSNLWDSFQRLQEYILSTRKKTVAEFIDNVGHSCDYFSLANPLYECSIEFENCIRRTNAPGGGVFSENKFEKSQNIPSRK